MAVSGGWRCESQSTQFQIIIQGMSQRQETRDKRREGRGSDVNTVPSRRFHRIDRDMPYGGVKTSLECRQLGQSFPELHKYCADRLQKSQCVRSAISQVLFSSPIMIDTVLPSPRVRMEASSTAPFQRRMNQRIHQAAIYSKGQSD